MLVSVRNLVEFIMRSGSIDSRYMGANRAQEGTRLHQKIQKLRKNEALLYGYEYSSEVVLKHTTVYEGIEITVEGRADGIIYKENEVIIEEIKSSSRPLKEIEPDLNGWHFAQAKCYGFMYCEQSGLEAVKIHLTYINTETEEDTTFEQAYIYAELKDFFISLIEKYYEWVKSDEIRRVKRDETIRGLAFPFGSYRQGQREFAAAVYKTVKDKKKIFAELPTGTGKTISTLFPVIKAMPEGLCEKAFYLTAKTITRQAAEQALKLMERRGLYIQSVTLTAKEKICLNTIRSCNPTDCPYADGHFDRVNEALKELLNASGIIKREDIVFYAQKHTVCPYELSLDAAMWSGVIICDYNYVFDPKVQLKRFFSNVSKTRFTALIDEAHNLVDRSRDMFSAVLFRGDFTTVRKLLKPKTPLYKALSKIDKYFSAMNKSLENKTQAALENMDTDLYYLIWNFQEKCDMWLVLNEGVPEHTDVFELYFKVLDFLRTAEYFDERYVFYIEKNMVKLLCLDPSYLLSQTNSKFLSQVFFSATFTPLDYFKDVLGGTETDYNFKLSSPFKNENLLLMVNSKISTKYKDRESSYDNIAECLYLMASAKAGNYFAFFSSYQYMSRVCDIFTQKHPDINTVVQKPEMNEEEREQFLNEFGVGNNGSLLGFVVMGGLFSEGIDLVGDRLIGAAVVGVGLPLITAERDYISAYYYRRGIDGYKFAYMYPGMNKVMQSAGRVIRTEDDRGVVFLIDTRFLTNDYLYLFPKHWAHFIQAHSPENISDNLENFWKS